MAVGRHYQLEVAEMDRRHRLLTRALSLAGAAALAVVAFWSAGLPPTQWWASAQRLFAVAQAAKPTGEDSAPAPVQAPTSTVPAAPTSSAETDSLAGTDSSLSTVPQPLLLISTSPGRNKREGTARMGTDADNPQTYVAGAILANGARLTEIHADHVALKRDGKILNVYVTESPGDTPTARSKGATELGMIGGSRAAATEALPLAQDRLSEVIRSMPYYENDALAGMQVFPGRQSAVFSQLGLRAGDVVIAQDGAVIADAADAADNFRTLTEGAAMVVTVRRDSRTLTISLDGALIVQATAKPDAVAQSTMTAGPPPL